jgi:hypothetical protein
LIERRITMTSAGEVIVGAINFPPGGDRIAATAGFVVLDDFSVSTVSGWALIAWSRTPHRLARVDDVGGVE